MATQAAARHTYADKDGQFRREPSKFRDTIPSSRFPAAAGRYVLYVNFGCPWAHRTIITRQLKGLEDVVELVEVDSMDRADGKGWYFGGQTGPDKDPIYGVKYLRQLYQMSEPEYAGRVTVPVLWDKVEETIVNNESSEIIRMFYNAFDELIPSERREETKAKAGLFPEHLRTQIEEMNQRVYDTINNGVYKTGFAASQEAYVEHVFPIFESLDRLESHLSQPDHQPYLFGEHITEADIRLYTTLARFDVAYYTIFKCNLKMIRHDYPKLHSWLRRLYWDESEKTNGGAFKKTTRFQAYKEGYTMAVSAKVVPVGPMPDILPL